ncbi:MAG: winged helix-turn-helix transcriptional regulator [Thermoplasmatota archaeon]|nr:helix-turn-helix transcriptional regulator [Halobacteriales archaeon]
MQHPPMHEADGCCPFQEAIDLLSRKHAMTIIWLLQQQEPRRFNEIKRAIDVNPVTLTQRLNELEEAGILHRKTFNETPPRVEYSLTSKGRDLVPLMDQLSRWARRHPIESPVAA